MGLVDSDGDGHATEAVGSASVGSVWQAVATLARANEDSFARGRADILCVVGKADIAAGLIRLVADVTGRDRYGDEFAASDGQLHHEATHRRSFMSATAGQVEDIV